MRRVSSSVALATAVAISALAATSSRAADQFHARQHFGDWHRHPSGFHYRPYYYTPHQQFVGFKHHYVIHYKARPQHHYFYNPYKKQFWGRCPVATEGKASYSLLAEKDRGGDINKIPESAFPEPGRMPPIPESSDGATLDLPPDDLPAEDALPTSG